MVCKYGIYVTEFGMWMGKEHPDAVKEKKGYKISLILPLLLFKNSLKVKNKELTLQNYSPLYDTGDFVFCPPLQQ